jgi:hypothetical protein
MQISLLLFYSSEKGPRVVGLGNYLDEELCSLNYKTISFVGDKVIGSNFIVIRCLFDLSSVVMV